MVFTIRPMPGVANFENAECVMLAWLGTFSVNVLSATQPAVRPRVAPSRLVRCGVWTLEKSDAYLPQRDVKSMQNEVVPGIRTRR